MPLPLFPPFFQIERCGLMRSALYIRDRETVRYFSFPWRYLSASGIWSEMTQMHNTRIQPGTRFFFVGVESARERRAPRGASRDGWWIQTARIVNCSSAHRRYFSLWTSWVDSCTRTANWPSITLSTCVEKSWKLVNQWFSSASQSSMRMTHFACVEFHIEKEISEKLVLSIAG